MTGLLKKAGKIMSDRNIKQSIADHFANKELIYEHVMNSVFGDKAQPKTSVRWRAMLAACLCFFVIIGGLSVFAISVEAKEYKEAVEFFNEYKLSTNGLSRTDIKKVYKDIIMETFTYHKTIEIFQTLSIEMNFVALKSANKEDLQALWKQRDQWYGSNTNSSGSYVKFLESDEKTSGWGHKTTIQKITDEKVVWSYRSEHSLYDPECIENNDGVYVYGTAAENDAWFGVLYLFDHNGNLQWKKNCKSTDSLYQKAVAVKDGITIFGTRYEYDGDARKYYLCVTNYDKKGNMAFCEETLQDPYDDVSAAAGIDGRYFIKLLDYDEDGRNYGNEGKFLSLSDKGKITDEFTYTFDGKSYGVQDIISYNGKIFISAMLLNVERQEFDKTFDTLMEEYYEAWQKQQEDIVKMPDEYDDRLNTLFQTQYTAALLVCDNNAVLTKAYSVENARCGELKISENKLLWQVMRIDDVKNANLYLSSRRVDIASTEFSFVFDGMGKLANKNEVGAYPLMY